MDPFEALSWLGTALFTAALVPQFARTWRLRSADEISPVFLVTVIAASMCMLAWALSLSAWVVGFGFVANMVVWGFVLTVRLRGPRASS